MLDNSPPSRRRVLKLIGSALATPWIVSNRAAGAENRFRAELADVLPFDLPATPQASPLNRRVFAHWHIFGISPDNQPYPDAYTSEYMSPDGFAGRYRKFGGYFLERPLIRPPRPEADWYVSDMADDVLRAEAIGIDAFIFNIVSVDPSDGNWLKLPHMLEAIRRVDSGLRVIPNLDAVTEVAPSVEDIAAALRSVAGHPGIMRAADGRMLLGSFYPENWPTARWKELFSALERAGTRISFFGTFLTGRHATSDYLALMDAVSLWSANSLGALRRAERFGDWVHAAGKKWTAPVWPQDCRPKDGWYAEAANSLLFRESWKSAMASKADNVQIITWNDYTEASEIAPSTGIQYAFYDLAAFYIAWFKSGEQPTITRDVLYYFHRIESTFGAGLGKRQEKRFELKFSLWPSNDVELLAFLTKPGRLEIEIDGVTTATEAPAGIVSLRAPLRRGRPVFRLRRDGRDVISLRSAFAIREEGDYQDLLYRGGSSTRAPVAHLAGG